LYINRAFLRYNQDDYFGAMADYDYALQLEPYNQIALFNRGLMLTEVNANDRALDDFTKVLELDPDDYRSLYNRALLYRAKGNTKAALADINRVIEAFPDFPGG
jgi:tetratricopeptide (TPR) repeat protein